MSPSDTIWFHGRCDRAGCARATKHKHLSSDPPAAGISHRPRLPSLAVPPHGGYFSDTMSVSDLIARLQQCPPDGRVCLDEDELMVVYNDRIATVANPFHPDVESFDADNNLISVSI